MTRGRIHDAVVIGAGPAGAVSAYRLARAGFVVLLVDRAVFPRSKVCGGCLSARSLAGLGAAGLETVGRGLGEPFDRVTIHLPGGSARTFPLPEGLAVDRARLDQRLVHRAVAAGAEFRPGVQAQVLPTRIGDTARSIALGTRETASARVAIAADGLGHPSLDGLASISSVVRPFSRIGLAAVVDGGGDPDRRVRMAISRAGYVGMVGIGDGRLNIAAALDPSRVHESGPARTVERVLADCGLDVPGSLAGARWSGTRTLTRRLARPSAFRLLVLGDAAGYTEPFTGEGMSWALEDALAAERLLLSGFGDWHEHIESDWARSVRSRRRRDWLGLLAARVLRSPLASRAAFGSMERLPGVARRGIGMAQASIGVAAE